MTTTKTTETLSAIADAIADSREHFKSNTAHAQFAGHVAHTLDNAIILDPVSFIMDCMPRAWVGSSKANAWERIARAPRFPSRTDV